MPANDEQVHLEHARQRERAGLGLHDLLDDDREDEESRGGGEEGAHHRPERAGGRM